MKLTVSNANITNTFSTARMTLANTNVVESITLGNVSVTPSQISVGNVSITPAAVSVPTLVLGGFQFSGGLQGGIINYQEFTANGTWYNPYANAAVNASLTGYEQVFVMAWGGGGGGSSNNSTLTSGGGGACVLGYYTLSNLANTVTITVGSGGTAARTTTTARLAAGDGGNTSFGSLVAYGGAGASEGNGGGGGGWLGAGGRNSGGSPLGANVSTFGGGLGVNATITTAGISIFGGGGGTGGSYSNSAGSSIYGGGGGGNGNTSGQGGSGGTSVFGGNGGNGIITTAGSIPGGGGGSNTSAAANGARGEVRVWVFGPAVLGSAPVYGLTANTTSLTESSSVLYTVTAENVANGTTLYYTLNNSSTATSADFSTAVNGSVIINGGSNTFTLTAVNDADSVNEAFTMDIRTGSTTGTIVASNGSVSIVPFVGSDIVVLSNTTITSTTTMNMPAGLLQNDMVIIAMQADNAVTVPSGWTSIVNTTFGSVFYKLMGSTPDSSVTLSSSTNIAAVCIALRNVDTSSPLDGTASSSATTNPPSITTTKANSYVFAVGFGYSGTAGITSPPSGYTLANTTSTASSTHSGIAYKKVTTAGLEDPGVFTMNQDTETTATFAVKNNVGT